MSALLLSLQHSAWKNWVGTLATPKKEHRMGLYTRTVNRLPAGPAAVGLEVLYGSCELLVPL